MSQFSYEEITDSFVERLLGTVSDAQSTVLIGPRYGGKRHVLFELRKLLKQQQITPVVAVQFLDQNPLQTEQEVRDRITEAVLAAEPELKLTDGHITEPIKDLARHRAVPAIVLASNVDGMAHHLARRFLEGIRTLVDGGQAIVVMSGENAFHELSYGPKVEFNVASQFFVKGYGEKEFSSSIAKYAGHLRFNIVEPDAFFTHLWRLTGGNLYIARLILSVLVETRANAGYLQDHPVTVADVPESFCDSALSIYGNHIFRHARQLIDRQPASWNELKALLADKEIPWSASANAPSHVELAGIGMRDEKATRIRFASPVMEEFCRLTYDNRKFGDLHVKSAQWPEAFAHYQKLAPEELIRPASSDDLNKVASTVNALAASLYSEATGFDDNPAALIEAVRELFAKGCHYILGFREVTFWYRDLGKDPPDPRWYSVPLETFKFTDSELDRIERLLPNDPTLTPGVLPLEIPWRNFAIAAILPTLNADQQAAVVISDLHTRPAISQERELLAKRLLGHFESAYLHALRMAQVRTRNRVQEKLIYIINDVFQSFRDREVSLQVLLSMAARGLRELNYRRVLFSMVDPEKNLLEGIVDDCDSSLQNVAHLISYPVEKTNESLSAHVLSRKVPMIISDARRHPMADKRVVNAGGLKAFAIIPILTPEKDAIGTLLVQRHGSVPDKIEVEDLQLFCQQLALAIEHSQRIYLLQSGLNRVPDPILIVDSNKRPRFANSPAAKLLNVRAGWQNQTRQVTEFKRSDAGPVIDLIHKALSSGHRLASHIPGIGPNSNYRGAVVASIINETWAQGSSEREKTLGGVMRIQDLTYLYKVLDASRHVAEAADGPTALRNMLAAAMQLGHEQEGSQSAWGRLYLARTLENGDEELVSSVSAGFTDSVLEDSFNTGKIVLAPRSQPGHYDWLCIEERTPVVFCWNDKLETGEESVTQHGLKAVNWKEPEQPPEIAKKAGDFWIDFPLLTKQGTTLGKICLQCDDDLQPENFVYLQILCATFSRMLETYANFERNSVVIRKETAQKSLSLLAHNLATRLGSFSIFLSEYRDFEKREPDLKEVNDSFEHAFTLATQAIRRANEQLKPVTPNLVRLDLAEHVEKALQAALPPDVWSFKCEPQPLFISIDIQLFEMALLEIIQNSKDAAPDLEKLKIDVQINAANGGRGRTTATIRYRDNGPGIPVDLAEQVFQDFYSRRPGKQVGTGLGLGYVRRVIEAHGGKVRSNGVAESGVEFVITLPV